MNETNQLSLIKEKREKQDILLSELCIDSQQTKELKQNLISCFEHISHFPNIKVSGDSIDAIIRDQIKTYTQSIEIIKEEYNKIKNCLTIDDMSGDIYSSTFFNEPTFIKQPNGKQQFPDVLLLCNYRGQSIEIKSSTNGDHMTWNGHLPRDNTIYILNGTARGIEKNTTPFLGKHVISQQEREILIEGREACKQNMNATTNRRLKIMNSKWDIYPRAMYNNTTEHLLQSPIRGQREKEVLDYLKLFDWNKKSPDKY
jgi:hypothetical protein